MIQRSKITKRSNISPFSFTTAYNIRIYDLKSVKEGSEIGNCKRASCITKSRLLAWNLNGVSLWKAEKYKF